MDEQLSVTGRFNFPEAAAEDFREICTAVSENKAETFPEWLTDTDKEAFAGAMGNFTLSEINHSDNVLFFREKKKADYKTVIAILSLVIRHYDIHDVFIIKESHSKSCDPNDRTYMGTFTIKMSKEEARDFKTLCTIFSFDMIDSKLKYNLPMEITEAKYFGNFKPLSVQYKDGELTIITNSTKTSDIDAILDIAQLVMEKPEHPDDMVINHKMLLVNKKASTHHRGQEIVLVHSSKDSQLYLSENFSFPEEAAKDFETLCTVAQTKNTDAMPSWLLDDEKAYLAAMDKWNLHDISYNQGRLYIKGNGEPSTIDIGRILSYVMRHHDIKEMISLHEIDKNAKVKTIFVDFFLHDVPELYVSRIQHEAIVID